MAQFLVKPLKSYGPWEGTKGPWLCWVYCYYLVSFDYFPLFLRVLTSLTINLSFGWSFSVDKRQTEDVGRRDHRVLLHFNTTAHCRLSQSSHSVVSNSAAPRTAARQASLSIANSRSLLKPMSIESVMPSGHLILCRPLLLPSIFPSIRVFSSESPLRIRWPKYWSFSFSISLSNEYSGLPVVCNFPVFCLPLGYLSVCLSIYSSVSTAQSVEYSSFAVGSDLMPVFLTLSPTCPSPHPSDSFYVI